MTIRITNQLFGTTPIAAHCPGPLHARWHHFLEAVLSQPRRMCRAPEITVFTWNTGSRPRRPTKPCGVFERTAERLGIEVLVLGRGKPDWKNRDKFAVTAEGLAGVRTPYVLGADSADVALLDNPQLAVDRFRQHFAAPLLFNATGSRCWPELPELVRFQQQLPLVPLLKGRHWINSGLLIGETAFTRDYFARLAAAEPVTGYEDSDQAVVMRTWNEWYPRVQADYTSQIFQWFNEDLEVMRLERPLAAPHKQRLEWLRAVPDLQTGAVVGVDRGAVCEAVLREWPNLHLWLVDPWQPKAAEASAGNPHSAEHAMNTALFWTEFARDRRFVLRETSASAARRFATAELDFVIFDTPLTDEQACSGIRLWWPKLRSGGLLIGHEVGSNPGTSGAVDEFAASLDRDVRWGPEGTWCVAKC